MYVISDTGHPQMRGEGRQKGKILADFPNGWLGSGTGFCRGLDLPSVSADNTGTQ